MKEIFIGSSNSDGAQEKATLLKGILTGLGAKATCWFELDVFRVATITIESLLEQTRKCHGAVFIFDEDDMIKSNGKEIPMPRGNVIYEAGLFAGALGKEAVAICLVSGVHQISDLAGVTYLRYTPKDHQRIEKSLSLWLTNNVRADRPPKSENNLLMNPRKDIHQLYTIESRLHLNDGGYRHIRRIRLMNLASNFILNPDIIDMGQFQQSPSELSKALQRILKGRTAVLDLMLAEPHPANLKDAVTKMANPVAGSRENLIYYGWEAIFNNMLADTIYKKAYEEHRFLYFSLNIVAPYALFGVEFDNEYQQYDHVKIDLYSPGIGSEDQRRSFIIWKDLDYKNYHFFIENFDRVKSDRTICQQPELDTIKGWLDEWNSRECPPD